MECERFEELLSPYLEGDLTREQKRLVDDHLHTCASCAELLSLMKEAKTSLALFPEIDVREELTEKLYALPQKKRKFRFIPDILMRPSFQPVMAAATVMLVLVSFYFFHPERSAINHSIERQLHIGISKVEKIYAEAESITHTLGQYKDNLLVSIKNFKPFRGNEDEQPKT